MPDLARAWSAGFWDRDGGRRFSLMRNDSGLHPQLQ